MDFKDQIKQLGERVVRLKDQIQTEEATKTITNRSRPLSIYTESN